MSDTIELGELPKGRISFSAYSSYLRCPKQFEYSYVDGIKSPPKGALILGRGTHKGLEWASKEHINNAAPPPLAQVKEAAAAGIESEMADVPASEVQWDEGDDAGAVKDAAVSLVEAYEPIRLENKPLSVEKRFEIEFSNTNYKMLGVTDLETTDGRVIDWKTTKKSYPANGAEISDQLTTYGIQNPEAKSLELHVMVRTKTPKLQVLKSAPRTPEQQGELLGNIARVAILIKTGIFPKVLENAPGSPCSWCGYYEKCRGKKRKEAV